MQRMIFEGGPKFEKSRVPIRVEPTSSNWVRTALASPPSSSSPADDTDMTLDMFHATLCHGEQTPGPLSEILLCIEQSVVNMMLDDFSMCVFFPDDSSMHSQMHAERHPTAPPLKKRKQLRYMTDGVLLRETLFEPDLDRYCAWKPCQENGTHFAIHSFKDTDVALQEYWVKPWLLGLVGLETFKVGWPLTWSDAKDCLCSGSVFWSLVVQTWVSTRLSSWTKRTNDPSTPMCCLECFGGHGLAIWDNLRYCLKHSWAPFFFLSTMSIV